MTDTTTPTGQSGLAATARRLVALVGDVAETRLSLAAIELEEQRIHIARQFVGLAWSLFLAGIATVLGGTWLVLVCPAEWRAFVVGVLAIGFGVAAAIAWGVVRARAERQPPPLHATLTELRKDLALLRDMGDES